MEENLTEVTVLGLLQCDHEPRNSVEKVRGEKDEKWLQSAK